jgi:tRNA nucleotidyltransferase (CCA-adding enzyme)
MENILKIASLFKNHKIKLVGGCVRDFILDGSFENVNDFDFATTALPEQMYKIFEEANIKISYNNEKYGMVTVCIDDRLYDISSTRMIVDGRIVYQSNWEIDAGHRDFTFNAMYMDVEYLTDKDEKYIHDYFNGQEDLKNGNVNFVMEAEDRIQEDYIRILRYFRFFAKYGTVHDPETITLIKRYASGLKQVSPERVWNELKKIACGPRPVETLRDIFDCGLFPHIGLYDNMLVLNFNYNILKDKKFHPVTLLYPIMDREKMKLSYTDYSLCGFLNYLFHEPPDCDKIKLLNNIRMNTWYWKLLKSQALLFPTSLVVTK